MKKISNISKTIQKKHATAKKAAISKIVDKVVDLVTPKRLPFGGKGGRKKKCSKPIEDLDNQQNEQEERISQQRSESASSNPMNDFFYTQDKFIEQFEDVEIFQFIRSKYPDFMSNQFSEIKSRRSILAFLDDELFVETVMRRYNMNIFELFKFMFRIDSQIFRPQFAGKIKQFISTKHYYSV